MSTKVIFIWGPGGVGKSHLAIRTAYQQTGKTLLITLDPSPRVFDLLGVQDTLSSPTIKLNGSEFQLKSTQVGALFDQLAQVNPARPTVRAFYDELVKGLHRFRDYLALIQLSDEIRSEKYNTVIIDTPPPFQEALGLHQSIFTLQHFFDRSLVQMALKSSWIQIGLKRITYVVRLFVGKKTAIQVFEFFEWLTSNIDRFQAAATHLKDLIFLAETHHQVIVTPETSPATIHRVKDFFEQTTNLEFIVNRSAWDFKPPSSDNVFLKEIRTLKFREEALLQTINTSFDHARIERLPLMVMGQDTREELLRFVKV